MLFRDNYPNNINPISPYELWDRFAGNYDYGFAKPLPKREQVDINIHYHTPDSTADERAKALADFANAYKEFLRAYFRATEPEVNEYSRINTEPTDCGSPDCCENPDSGDSADSDREPNFRERTDERVEELTDDERKFEVTYSNLTEDQFNYARANEDYILEYIRNNADDGRFGKGERGVDSGGGSYCSDN